MSKLLVVLGATGQQGGSVIDHVLNDTELSQTYRIRALTRDVNSEKSNQLKHKSEVVYCDVQDRKSLETALTGAHTVFIMTSPTFSVDGLELEYQTAKLVADVAHEKSAKYLIFSTLPSVRKLSKDKYTKVDHFEAKARAEEYIRGLPVQSAFVSLGFFMGNFQAMPFLAPQKKDGDTWVISRFNSSRALLPMVDAVGDTGKFVGAILAEPDKYDGMTVCASAALYDHDQVAAILSKSTGKRIVFEQVPVEEWKASLPFAADIFEDSFMYWEDVGYYGPESEELVKWAAENARGKVSSLEDYFQAHPLRLE